MASMRVSACHLSINIGLNYESWSFFLASRVGIFLHILRSLVHIIFCLLFHYCCTHRYTSLVLVGVWCDDWQLINHYYSWSVPKTSWSSPPADTLDLILLYSSLTFRRHFTQAADLAVCLLGHCPSDWHSARGTGHTTHPQLTDFVGRLLCRCFRRKTALNTPAAGSVFASSFVLLLAIHSCFRL